MAADHSAYFEEVEARFAARPRPRPRARGGVPGPRPRDSWSSHSGFEALHDAAPPRLRERVAGELLRSEIEVSTPRTLHFGQAAKQTPAQSRRAVSAGGPGGLRSGRRRHASLLGLEGPGDHRHAALPSCRGAAQVRRLAQQHVGGACARGGARLRPRRRRVRRPADVSAAPAGALGQLPLHRGRVDRAALGRAPRPSCACSRAAASRTSSARGPSTGASTRNSSTPTASRSSRRSGGLCDRTIASAPSRCASATPRTRPGRVSRSRR